MILDGRTIPNGTVVESDLCVIGCGAAGITLALELAGRGISVTILESGGLTPDIETQALYRGEITGLPNYPLDACRLRYFGGSTGHWGGWCRQFERIDFEKRPWVPDSGWPIAYEELARFYPRAHEICEISDGHFDPSDFELPNTPPLNLFGDEVLTKLVQFSVPLRFGTRYRDDVEKASNVRVLLNSNVTSIDVNKDGKTVVGLSVATLSGVRFKAHAKQYVLATGGLENPRLLLASNAVMQHGIGNDRDHVGRYFMDHIQLDCAQVLPFEQKLNCNLYQVDSRHVLRKSVHPNAPPVGVMGYLALSDALQRRERILNYSAQLYLSYWSDYFLHVDNADNSDKPWWSITGDALETIWTHLKDATGMALDRLPGRDKKQFYKIQATQEQAPNPLSRVTLDTERDALGMPRARLNWDLTELDRYTLGVALKNIAVALGGNQIARLHVPVDYSREKLPAYMRGSWHHYGTTRMSEGPERGVVNRDCRVHGIANLYIAGCSVFPTSSHGNPTLSIIAMAARLAEHLRTVLK